MLQRISSSNDVKALPESQLPALCDELRRFLVSSVSATGGHLASNLGVVELMVAIHRIYDTERDRLVFDVGHQCYVHKILTGRGNRFDRLRQFDGISGFPKPEESDHDAFIAGHASNSVSVALGMARARRLTGADYDVVALIGDGALTGGLAYEGLNDAGDSGEPMVVILNDNGMSIDPNVGGVASHLGKLRSRPGYYRFKKSYRSFMDGIPGGGSVYRALHKVKTNIKKAIYPCSMFEDMGFTYLGPVDGHNLEQLCSTLAWAKEMKCPVLVHVRTIKGKGYAPAERQPELSHGVSAFDPVVGPVSAEREDFSAVMGNELTELAEEDSRICAITAAMGPGTGLQKFSAVHHDRFFDVGIAEGHAVAMAAGMAKQGMIPVFAVYSTFLQRGYDMLMHDVALQGLHVVLAVDRAGLVGADGPTHHGCMDVGYLTQMPGMTVYSPANYQELRGMLRAAVVDRGPVAVRYPRGGEGCIAYPVWQGESAVQLQQGDDITLVSYGVMTDEIMAAADALRCDGIGCDVVKLGRIAPLDASLVCESVRCTGRLLVLEDCLENGCIGQKLAAEMMKAGVTPGVLILKNIGSDFVGQGTVSDLRREAGLDAVGVIKAVREVLHG